MKTSEWELELKRGDLAPFSGVLVPEDAYRFYQTDAAVYAGCEARLKASLGLCTPEDEGWFTSRQMIYFALGMGAAALIYTHD